MRRGGWITLAGVLVLLMAAEPALADRGSVLSIVGAIFTLASGGTGAPAWYAWVGVGLSITGRLVSSSDARRAQRKLQAQQRQKFNDNLQARNVTLLTAEPPFRGGYGRCVAGGDVLAVFTTDKIGTREDGSTYVKPDALKHLVIHYLSRQAQAIHDVLIDGVRVGALDVDGYPTGGEFFQSRSETRSVSFTGSITLPDVAVEILNSYKIVSGGEGPKYEPVTVTLGSGGTTVSTAEPGEVWVNYRLVRQLRSVRVRHFLGTPGQTVDTYLNGLLPTKWTTNHRLRGLAGCIVTLDLEDQRFQGGLPNIVAEGSWALVYDPRLDSTVPGGSGSHRADDPSTWTWSDNAALCTRDHLANADLGYGCDATDIDDADTITAANACDVLRSFDDGSGAYSGKTYTCNGVFTAEQSREAVLEQLTESMAGFAVPDGQWRIIAGAWTPPVRELVDDDLAGSIEIVTADTPMDELMNSARGSYIASGKTQPSDANPPYTNPVLVAEDEGVPLWGSYSLPWTNSNARVRNLLRIKVERSRNGLICTYPGKLRLWGLRVGERVSVTNATYGWVRKTFRITDRGYTQGAPVQLTLQEDAADIWDDADAGTADATPNTGLPNPRLVDPLASLAAASSSSTLVRTADGTVVPRVRVSWSAITSAYVVPDGKVLLRWRRNTDIAWQALPPLPGDATEYTFAGPQEGDAVVVEGVVRNTLGSLSDARFATVYVAGKSTAPANVAGFAGSVAKGRIAWSWTPSAAPDYGATELRTSDANWGSTSTPPVFRGKASAFPQVVAAAGSYTLYARHLDTSGNPSAAAVSATVVVAAGDLVQDGAPGANGTSVFTATVFLQSASAPSAPSGGTFNFSTATLTPPWSWTAAQPAVSSTPTYSTTYTFSATTPGATVTAGTWGTPVLVAQVGTSGPVVPGPLPTSANGTASPTTCVSGVRFLTDGNVARKASGTSSTYTNYTKWFNPTGGTPGSGYWIKFRTREVTNTSGSVTVGGATNTWQALSSDRTVTLTAAAGADGSALVDYWIAADSAGDTIVSSGVIDLQASST